MGEEMNFFPKVGKSIDLENEYIGLNNDAKTDSLCVGNKDTKNHLNCLFL